MKAPTSFLLLFSGFSALCYQVIWIRLLGLSIGMTSAAVGAVLAAVFLGMALGAWLTSRLPQRWSASLRTFALVEVVVGCCALLLLPLLLNLDQLMAQFPSLGSQLWFRFAVVTLLLAIPAAGLGAAYPLLASVLSSRQGGLGEHLGALYAMHTSGAVLGALLVAFLLIPMWGLDGALYVAVAMNLLAALLALMLHRGVVAGEFRLAADLHADKSRQPLALAALLATGFTSVAVEIAWIKYLAIYIEATFYGYAILLALFLGGMALGAWASRRLLAHHRVAPQWLATGLLLLALSMIISRIALGLIPATDTYLDSLQLGDSLYNTLRYAAVLVAMLPTVFLFGVLFPLALTLYCGNAPSVTASAGKAYAANTLAGLAGAVLTALWLIPHYGTDTLLLLMTLLVMLFALPFAPLIGNRNRRHLFIFAAASIAIAAPLLPGIDFRQMLLCMECSEGLYRQGGKPEFLYLKEGKSGVVSLVTYDGSNIILENNGLQESRIIPGYPNRSEVLLAMLPYYLKADAKNAFVVGFGGGMTSEVLATTPLQSLRIVELEPAIVEAIASLKGGNLSLLQDPRVSLEFNDARNTLLLEPWRYDLIVSQPSHPWRAGSAAVFTREYFRIVHSRLQHGGVFVQWLNLSRMDATTLRAVLRAFYEEFPQGAVFSNRTAPDLFLVGSDEKLVLDHEVISEILGRREFEYYNWAIGVANPRHLLVKYYLMSRSEALAFAGDAVPNSDLNLITETRLGRLHDKPAPEDDPLLLLEPFYNR